MPERVFRPVPPRLPDSLAVARLLRECQLALRESAAEHGYRSQACKAIREYTLKRYHDQSQERLWTLADDVQALAEAYATAHQRERQQERRAAAREPLRAPSRRPDLRSE